jgi:hypothetical protein
LKKLPKNSNKNQFFSVFSKVLVGMGHIIAFSTRLANVFEKKTTINNPQGKV